MGSADKAQNAKSLHGPNLIQKVVAVLFWATRQDSIEIKYPGGKAFMERKEPSETLNVSEVQYLDLKKLSIYCSLGVSTLREYLKRGTLPHYILPGKIIVKKSEFDSWMEEFKVDGRENLEALVEDVVSSIKH